MAIASLLLGAFAAPCPAIAASTGDIGVVVAAKQTTGTLADQTRKLAKGDPIYRSEVLETGKTGSGEFRLGDDSKIALGPGARLTLDEAVYDGKEGSASVVLELVAGAFRFLTGKLDHDAYKIKVGAASLAVRGTVFDVFVDADHNVVVLLHEGAVDICTTQCRRHDKVGRVVHVSPAGLHSAPIEWHDKLLPGIRLNRAFPFLRTRLSIDPVRRLGSIGSVARPAIRTGGKVVRKAGKAARSVVRRTRRLLRSPF